MMDSLALPISWWSVSGVLLTELLYRIPWGRWVAGLLDLLGQLVSALYHEELSEDEQEALLRKLALGILGESFRGAGFMALMMGGWIALETLGSSLGVGSMLSWWGGVALTISSLAYLVIRIRWISRVAPDDQRYDEYSHAPTTQSFYAFALDHPAILDFSFNRERKRVMKRGHHVMVDRPVWVCGLARAGTTILTELLYDTGHFASLTYRDMPFPLAPSLWRALSRWSLQRDPELRERAHGDGLMIGVDSPEALEEVFWRTQSPGTYLDPHVLAAYTPSDLSIKRLREYISCVLESRERRREDRSSPLRYLSKNNNHLIRLPALIEAFPQGHFIIPIRHPLEHAESLRRQHLRWIDRHKRDPFSRRYMGWLCHYEFGSDHRAFALPICDAQLGACEEYVDAGSDDTIDLNVIEETHTLTYWLIRWLEAYRWVATLDRSRIFIVDYRALNTAPYQTISALSRALDLDLTPSKIKQMASRLKPVAHVIDTDDVNPNLIRDAEALYASFVGTDSMK